MIELTLHHGGRVLIDPATIRDVSEPDPDAVDTPEKPAQRFVQLRAHDGHCYDVKEGFDAVRLILAANAQRMTMPFYPDNGNAHPVRSAHDPRG